MSRRVGVLALQGAVGAHLRLLRALGADAVEVRRPADLDGLEGIVLPGGESTTMWQLLGRNELEVPLRRQLAGGLPALGTCAGMILLAREVLDGREDQGSFASIDLRVRRNAFGSQVESFEAPLEIAGIGEPTFHGVFIRAPLVVEAGDGVEVLASVDGAAVACRQGPVLVTSFHPELAGDDRLHRLFLDCAGPTSGR